MSRDGEGNDAHLFESFAQLVTDLGKAGTLSEVTAQRRQALLHKIFARYIRRLPKPLSPGTGKQLFRLLFPHEGSRRRYGFKETTLVRCLEDVLGSRGLSQWDTVDRSGRGLGCLGLEVQRAAYARTTRARRSTITIAQVDGLLDQLARTSKWSQMERQAAPAGMAKEPRRVLIDLYHNSGLSPRALAVLTQVILRDLRPLLMPLPKPFNVNSFADPKYNAVMLSLGTAIGMWDFQMSDIYTRQSGDLDFACDQIEVMGGGAGKGCSVRQTIAPVLGHNILIPKCAKGRSISSALRTAVGRSATQQAVVWAETKYDGERMQIHVDISGARPSVKIFSKSTRDSTNDRSNAQSVILAALGIQPPAELPRHSSLAGRMAEALSRGPRFRLGVILEAELVPYNEATWEGGCGPGIEEFWKLGYEGIKQGRHQDHGTRHLHIAFFDILYIDGCSLLGDPYAQRRAQLQMMVHEIPGFTHLAVRHRIDLASGFTSAERRLEVIFDQSSRDREGPDIESRALAVQFWLSMGQAEGLGDSVDLVCIGAGWDMDRARELRVDTSVYTTYYVGVCTNKALVGGKGPERQKPHFEVLFCVSWGLDRQQIVDQSMRIHHRDPVWSTRPFEKDDPRRARLQGLSYTFSLPDTLPQPSAIFDMPRCVEVMGAGFQKLPKSQHYELRWPRLQKMHDLRERPWTEALDAADYLVVARTALGYNGNPTPSPNSIDNIWNCSASIACHDVVSSPEKSTISPIRPAHIVFKKSPLSPVKTVSLSTLVAPRRSLAASNRLRHLMVQPLTAPSSLPPMPLSPRQPAAHHEKSPTASCKKSLAKRLATSGAKSLHAKQLARRGGLVLALGTGLRRKRPGVLAPASLHP